MASPSATSIPTVEPQSEGVVCVGSEDPVGRGITPTETHLTATPTSPVRRRPQRVSTFRTVEDFTDYDVRPGWRPGAEPGVDPTKPDGGHASVPSLSAHCEITVVDFCEDEIAIQHLDNDTLVSFLKLPQPKWSTCRWISVNGLSWDVIQALGQHKKLHKLAIEDIMNTRNRTKAEWFPSHAFIVLTLQKLVHICDSDGASGANDGEKTRRSGGRLHGLSRRIKSLFGVLEERAGDYNDETGEYKQEFGNDGLASSTPPSSEKLHLMRTMQRYHGRPNDPRAALMEQYSALASKDLAVAAEQVAMLLMNDNTIISFFEMSAKDIEQPIVRRLQTPDTILRQSCDASMIGQSIIDAIIDLAIPVTSCYADVVADLELDVLTQPNIKHTKSLYIMVTEINKMLGFIIPITNLINALREHKADKTQDAAAKELQNPKEGVIITPLTYTYLGDVLDHCVLITESLDQIRKSADGMIDLIFNTISAFQNESMKQLTVATIIFLPLTFLTGYFGQNFEPFNDLQRGVSFFWMIATPVTVAIMVLLMRDMIWDSSKALVQRRHIGKLRKDRRSRAKKRA